MATFPKSQHLCSRKAINALFGSGNRCISAFPLRVVYKETDISASSREPVQVLFSVSKRRFKHAVDRNRAKRQMREAWRQHRHLLCQSCSTPAEHPTAVPDAVPDVEGESAALPAATPALPLLHIAFLWLSDTPMPSALVQRKMKKLICAVSSSFPSASTSDSSPR